VEYFTSDKLKDIFNICICDFAYMHKISNWSIE